MRSRIIEWTLVGLLWATPTNAAGRPNGLFIAIDDLNDWAGYLAGHPQTKTPNLDRLATTGVFV